MVQQLKAKYLPDFTLVTGWIQLMSAHSIILRRVTNGCVDDANCVTVDWEELHDTKPRRANWPWDACLTNFVFAIKSGKEHWTHFWKDENKWVV